MGSAETKTKSSMNLQEPLRGAAVQGLEGAQELYGRPESLPGMYVGIDPYRQQGLQSAADLAQGGAMVQPMAIGQYTSALGGEYLDPSSNPYLEEMVNRSVLAAQGAVNRGTGRYGSGTWANAMADATTGTAARLYSAAYEAERDRMTQLMGLAPQMSALEYAPSSELERVGASYEADQFAQQAEEARQFMWPYQAQKIYEQSVGSSPLVQEYRAKSKTETPFNMAQAAAMTGSFLGDVVGGLGGGLLGGGGGGGGGGGFGSFGGGGGGGFAGMTSPGWPSTTPSRYLPTSTPAGANLSDWYRGYPMAMSYNPNLG